MGDREPANGKMARREFLQWAGGAAAVTAAGVLGGCSSADEEATTLEIPLESVPVGGRVRVVFEEMPIEVARSAEGVTARSLWCTHTGCEVKWLDDRQIYLCPCHEGEFDAGGRPIAGPPPRPLRQLQAVIHGDTILLEPRAVAVSA